MSPPLKFMCGSSTDNDWIKGSADGWEWSTRGAGYEDERDFFSVHWQIDLPRGFFPDRQVNSWKGRFPNWQIDTPKNHPRATRIAVLLHVASPRHDIDPALNDLKQEVIEAMLNSAVKQQVRVNGFEYEIGR